MSSLNTNKLAWALGLLGLMLIGQGLYIPVKAQVAQLLLQHAWAQTQQGDSQVKPWPWADTYPLARLEIPAIGQDFIVLGGSTGSTLAFGPGHLTGTALPHEQGHVVLSAHRDTHFSRLRELDIGDYMHIETKSGELRKYVIQQTQIINSEQESLWLDHGLNQLTLITCYPFDAAESGGPLRFRLDAIRVEI